MICKKCGAQVAEGMKFCSECGTKMDEILAPEVVETVPERKIRFNIGHLGVLFGSILSFISLFIHNPGIFGSSSIVGLLSQGRGDGAVYALILVALLVFTTVMTYINRGILAIVGSVGVFGWTCFMLKRTGESLLSGRGLFLLFVAAILIVAATVANFKINKRNIETL